MLTRLCCDLCVRHILCVIKPFGNVFTQNGQLFGQLFEIVGNKGSIGALVSLFIENSFGNIGPRGRGKAKANVSTACAVV